MAGLSTEEFQCRIIGLPGDGGVEVKRWLRGSQAMGPQTIERINKRLLKEEGCRRKRGKVELELLCKEMGVSKVEKAQDIEYILKREKDLSGTALLFRSPLWRLLDLRTFYEKQLFTECASYLKGKLKGGVWRCPHDGLVFEQGQPLYNKFTLALEKQPPVWSLPHFGKDVRKFELLPVKPWNDSGQLFNRGDIYGFIGILAALRYAVLCKDMDLACHHCVNAHRALASIGRNETFRPFWKRIAVALFRLQKFLGVADVAPSLSTIKNQIENGSVSNQRRNRNSVRNRIIYTTALQELGQL